jgi:hypothetical protein
MTLCDRATYVHLGRKAATISAPLTPRLFEARLRLVMALLLEDVRDASLEYEEVYTALCDRLLTCTWGGRQQ